MIKLLTAQISFSPRYSLAQHRIQLFVPWGHKNNNMESQCLCFQGIPTWKQRIGQEIDSCTHFLRHWDLHLGEMQVTGLKRAFQVHVLIAQPDKQSVPIRGKKIISLRFGGTGTERTKEQTDLEQSKDKCQTFTGC